MKKEILKLTGLTEDQFYKMYPTEAAFKAAYPNFKLGGLTEAFPQIATADNFFSYGVPVPPTIHAYGGPIYPQIQTEAQFFSPVYSNSNNAYANGGAFPTMDKGGPRKKKKQREAEDLAANKVYDKMTLGYPTDAYDEFANISSQTARDMSGRFDPNSGIDTWQYGNQIYDPGAYANWINKKLGRQAIMPLQKPFEGPYNLIGRTPNWQNLPNQINLQDYTTEDAYPIIDYRTLTPSSKKDYLSGGPEIMGRGGSYMEAYPQAKRYPQGPVGGSAFYAMQDGGSSMQEPTKDQTFYTQKMNDFFDKLRQNSYKNMMGAIMNTDDQYSDGMKQLSVGQFGGRQPLNFYIPNNQTSWRNIREQKGLGLGDLTPEQLEAIKTGAANVADISYETRRAILPKNRIKSVNVKFKRQGAKEEFKGTPYLMPGQKAFDPTVPSQAATTTAAPAQNQQMAPAPGTQGMSPYGPYLNEYLFGPDNAPATVNAQVAAQQAQAVASAASPTPLAVPKDVELDDGTYATEEEAKAKGYTKDSSGNWKSPGVSTPPSNTQSMDPNVAKKKATMQTPSVNQPYIDAQKPKYTLGKVTSSATPNGSLQSWADIEKAIGPAPKVITGSYFEKINDYCSQFPGAQGCYSEPYSKLPNQENIGPNERRNYFNVEEFKKMPYVQQVLMAIQSPRFRRGANDEIIDPYEVIGAPFRLAADYDTGIGEEYYKTTRDGKRISSSTPFTDLDPAYRFRYSDDPNDVYSQFITPEMAKDLRYGPAINKKYGGPYVLPMYQGMVGPSQTGFQAPWQRTLDITNPDNYKLNAEGKSEYVDPSASAELADEEEFEVGVDVSRVKKFDEYFPAKVQMAADIIGKIGQNKADKKFMRMMMKPENWANPVPQSGGDHAMNQPAGADFRPDQMVPVSQYGGVMMYDMADLFFLTPQMLKKTQSRR